MLYKNMRDKNIAKVRKRRNLMQNNEIYKHKEKYEVRLKTVNDLERD